MGHPTGQGSLSGLLGGLGGLSSQEYDPLSAQRAAQGRKASSYEQESFARMAAMQAKNHIKNMTEKDIDKTIIQELQAEVDEWLSDID